MNCKFTDINNETYGGTQWVPGEWRETDGAGELCGPGWLHYYEDPLLAELHNPIYGGYSSDARLWEVEVAGEVLRDGQLKSGCSRLRLLREIERPQITTTQRVAYGILAAREVCAYADWNRWADRWLSGEDRSADAAARSAWAAWAAWAAEAARWAARSATEAARWAARSAAEAARWAVWAADLDLLALAKQAMEIEIGQYEVKSR